MSQLQNEIEEVELTIAEARKMVEYGQVVRRLIDNPDFKKVVTEDYFGEEGSRLALLYSDPNLDENQVRMVNNDLLGLGAFKRFIKTKLHLAAMAQHELETSSETLEELRNEELGMENFDDE